jgi:hypothetical protein
MGLSASIRSVLADIFRNNNFKYLTGIDLESLKEEITRFKPINKEKIIIEQSLKVQTTLKAYIAEKV